MIKQSVVIYKITTLLVLFMYVVNAYVYLNIRYEMLKLVQHDVTFML